MGHRRGAHQDGAEICSQYLFKMPKNENDLTGFVCDRCGRRDSEHVIIAPSPMPSVQSSKPAVRQTAPPALKPAQQQLDPLAPPEAVSSSACSGQLDDSTDPLALAARPRPAAAAAAPVPATDEATDETAPVTGGEPEPPSGSGADDAFKAEVERMVQEAVAREQREAAAFRAEVEAMVRQSRPPAVEAQPSAEAAPPGAGPAAGDVEAWLASLSLAQHAAAFRGAGVTPGALAALLREDRARCDARLKELGVKSVGARLRIVNAVRGV